MPKCKICKTKVKLINQVDCLKTYYCKKCKKQLHNHQIIEDISYITFCPYCKEYLADCGYKNCMYCGRKLYKPLIKKKMEV